MITETSITMPWRAGAIALLRVFALFSLPLSAVHAQLVAPYVPTPQEDVELMLEVVNAGPGDYVIDLGSGDGRIVIEAARRGAMGHGVELDGDLVHKATLRAEKAGVGDRVYFVRDDIFKTDFSLATVVTMYLMPEANMRLRPLLMEKLRPGTRVVSNNFHMGSWRSDAFHDSLSSGGLHVWIVPADVAGDWLLELPGERITLSIEQHFQNIHPRARQEDRNLRVEDAVLRGDRISFIIRDGQRHFAVSGRVDDEGMSGYVQNHGGDNRGVGTWRASRP